MAITTAWGTFWTVEPDRPARPSPWSLALVVAIVLVSGPGAGAEGDAGAPGGDGGRRAWDAWQAGRTSEALEASTAAVRERPDLASTWVLHGYLLSLAGRKAEAAQAYLSAIRIDPRDAVAQNNYGVVLLDLGRALDAEAAFRMALALDAGYADAHNNLGVALERGGRVEEAGSAYLRATDLAPDHAYAHNNRGALAMRQGRAPEAEAALRAAHRAAPHLGLSVLNMALLRGGDPTAGEAFDRLQEAAERPGAARAVRARALVARAEREAATGRFSEARTLYLQALEAGASDPATLNNLAVVEDRLGLDRDAMLHLEAALAQRPDDLVARNNVGVVHVHRGSWDLAADVFTEILERDARFHRANYNLGVVRAAQGRLAESRRSFERAASLAPGDADVRYNLAVLRRRMGGTPAQERADYEAALRLDDNLAEAHLSLGCFLADPGTPRNLRSEARARYHLQRFLALALESDAEGRAQAEAWLSWLERRAS